MTIDFWFLGAVIVLVFLAGFFGGALWMAGYTPRRII
jgi:hypothetical protein